MRYAKGFFLIYLYKRIFRRWIVLDRDEFALRVSLCRRKLLSIALRRLSKDECEDAVQSAVLSAWAHLPQLRDESAFEAWLTQILINECKRRLLSKKKENAAAKAIASRLHKPPVELHLREALAQMSPEERKILLLHHEEGYAVSEIAKQVHASEAAVKMRLYRARKSLQMILMSLLLLLLLTAAAIGSGLLDIDWFLKNRRAVPAEVSYTDLGSENSISYTGLYLSAELTDVKWDMDRLELLLSYALAGKDVQSLIVHSGSIGVDGKRFDHIWTSEGITPVTQWADGKDVYTYHLEGWRIQNTPLASGEDSLTDGKGEAFMAQLQFDRFDPQTYAALIDDNGTITLTNRVIITDHSTEETIEEGVLTFRISAPDIETWRKAYEAYSR